MTHTTSTYGLHAVQALIKNNPQRVTRLLIQRQRHDKKMETLLQLAEKASLAIEYVTKDVLDRMTNDANHQGVLAVLGETKSYTEHDLDELLSQASSPAFILILDGVQDPHNLGACFRSADAAGVQMIIAPKDKSVGITPVVSKVASGAVETVPFIQVTNLVRTLEKLKQLGIWIYGADSLAPQTLFQADFKSSCALVLGAEGTGLRRLTREHCDFLLNIPMRGNVSSLNVSVATGIFLFEVVRQRMR